MTRPTTLNTIALFLGLAGTSLAQGPTPPPEPLGRGPSDAHVGRGRIAVAETVCMVRYSCTRCLRFIAGGTRVRLTIEESR